jgi:hypothetical protein
MLRKSGLTSLQKPCIIYNMNVATAPNQSQQILRRIKAKGAGWAFSPHDFYDLGDPRAISMALSRLTRSGKIRRISHGLYDVLHKHPILGQVGAPLDSIIDAIGRKRNLRILPSTAAAAAAANQLGLSTQVPARLVYHTDGAPSRVTLGNLQIDLRRNTGRMLALAGRSSGLVAQALRELGKDKVTADHIQRVRSQLPTAARKQLLQDIQLVPAWMRPHFKSISRDDD